MVPESPETLAQLLQAALEAQPYLFRPDFPFRTAARQIADACIHDADGQSRYWVASPLTNGAARPGTRPVFTVRRLDGQTGVWDALTQDEGDVVADVLTALALEDATGGTRTPTGCPTGS
jgi:hypothetical protein